MQKRGLASPDRSQKVLAPVRKKQKPAELNCADQSRPLGKVRNQNRGAYRIAVTKKVLSHGLAEHREAFLRLDSAVIETVDKCTLCYHRITQGLTTACCENCPTGARQLVDFKNPKDPVHEFLCENKVAVLKPNMATEAKVYYKNLDGSVR